MTSEKIFQITLSVSIVAHTLAFLSYSGFNFKMPEKKQKETEVVYIKMKEERPVSYPKQALKPLPALPDKATLKKTDNPPPMADKDTFKDIETDTVKDSAFRKPSFVKTDINAVKRKVTLPDIKVPSPNNPAYMNYYQLVRERIRRSAYQNYNHNQTGEVYLSFIISSAGQLKEVRLMEGKDTDSRLKDIAMRSIKNASPFPKFPKELDYPQLSFNVIISFEIE